MAKAKDPYKELFEAHKGKTITTCWYPSPVRWQKTELGKGVEGVITGWDATGPRISINKDWYPTAPTDNLYPGGQDEGRCWNFKPVQPEDTKGK